MAWRNTLVALAATACAHAPAQPARSPQPAVVRWSHVDLGRCGPIASVGLEMARSCELTITELGRPPRYATLPPADCDAAFAQATSPRLVERPGCPVAAQFIAGVEVQLTDGKTRHGCEDDPLALAMARLAERHAPEWHTPPAMGGGCGFEEERIDGTVVKPAK